MKKSLKIAGIVLGVVVLVFVALLILVQVLVTPERIRERVLPMAREALNGREVELGDIQVSLFSGIRLDDLRIGSRGAEEDFVSADRVVLRYQFLPLLAKRVVVDEVRLVDPVIRIERYADGQFNFSDLTEGEKQPTDPAAGPAQDGPPVDLLVSEIALENGELVFLDHAVGTDEPYLTRLSALQIRASDISLDENFPVTLEAMINQASLEVEASVDPQQPGGRADIHLADFDVTAFAPYYRDKVPGRLNGLSVDLDLQVEGSSEQALSGGNIVLREIDFQPAEAEEPLRIELIRLDYNVEADLEKDFLKVDDTVLNLNGIPLQVSGSVADLTGESRLDMVLAVAEIDLPDVVQAIPESMRQPAIDLEPAGAVELEIHLAGPADAEPAVLLQEGKIGLREVTVTVGGIRPTLSGLLKIVGDSLTSQNLVLRAGENSADIELKAENLLGDAIVVSNSLTSQRFELDALLAAAAAPVAEDGEAHKDAETGGEATSTEELGPIDLPLKVDGTVQIGETVYRGLAMTDFDLRYRLADNVLTVDRLSGNLAEGSLSQTARVDLGVKGLAYRGRIEVDGVKAHPFVSAFLPAATGTVFGTLNLDGSFSGRGTRTDALKRNLSAKGDFSLLDGKLTGAGLVQELAGYLDLEELRVMQFSKATGDLALDKGKVRINSNFAGSDIRMAPQGTIGLDGALDLALNARLAPGLTDRLGGDLGNLLSGQEGWALLPLKVGGTWESPRFVLDTSALKRQATEKVKQKLQEKLLDKIAPERRESADGEGEVAPERKLLDDALRGIFGN